MKYVSESYLSAMLYVSDIRLTFLVDEPNNIVIEICSKSFALYFIVIMFTIYKPIKPYIY